MSCFTRWPDVRQDLILTDVVAVSRAIEQNSIPREAPYGRQALIESG
jgi:hypothetical protein